jgi:hypothetical protein
LLIYRVSLCLFFFQIKQKENEKKKDIRKGKKGKEIPNKLLDTQPSPILLDLASGRKIGKQRRHTIALGHDKGFWKQANVIWHLCYIITKLFPFHDFKGFLTGQFHFGLRGAGRGAFADSDEVGGRGG